MSLKNRPFKNDMEIPLDELVFITPEERKVYFTNLIDNYKVFFPKLELVYAYLNFNSNLKNDYILVFRNKEDPSVIVWDFVFQYTTRSLPGYRYACNTNQQAQFFKMCNRLLYTLPVKKFRAILKMDKYDLDWNEKSDKHWKSINNVESLYNLFEDFSGAYVHKDK